MKSGQTPVRTALALLLISLLPISQVLAEDSLPVLGSWASGCEFFGQPARCVLVWKQGQHASLVEMHYSVTAQTKGDDENDTTLFNGRSTLKRNESVFEGFWSASNGAIHPVFARLEEAELNSHWGDAATEQGKSRYRVLDNGQLEVIDWVLTEQGWREFMRVKYDRQ